MGPTCYRIKVIRRPPSPFEGGKPRGKRITNKKRLVSHGLLSLPTSHPSTATASKYLLKSHIFLLQRKKTKSRTVIIKNPRFYCLKAEDVLPSEVLGSAAQQLWRPLVALIN